MLLVAAGHELVGTVADGDALLELLETEPVDIAVLDIRMPPEPDGGLSTAARVRQRHPLVGLLLLSHYAESQYLMRVLQIGTERIGYRLKDKLAGVQVLSDTLVRVAAGEIVIEPSVARKLVDQPRRHGADFGTLSARETDVLRLMAEGRSNNGIADALHLSTKAVEKHVASIFTKLALPPGATAHHRRVLAVLAYLRTPGADS